MKAPMCVTVCDTCGGRVSLQYETGQKATAGPRKGVSAVLAALWGCAAVSLQLCLKLNANISLLTVTMLKPIKSRYMAHHIHRLRPPLRPASGYNQIVLVCMKVRRRMRTDWDPIGHLRRRSGTRDHIVHKCKRRCISKCVGRNGTSNWKTLVVVFHKYNLTFERVWVWQSSSEVPITLLSLQSLRWSCIQIILWTVVALTTAEINKLPLLKPASTYWCFFPHFKKQSKVQFLWTHKNERRV